MTLDFTEPELARTPVFTRCDGRRLAREADDDVWVAARPDCGEGEPAVEVAFALEEATGAGDAPAVTVEGRPLTRREGRPGDAWFVYGYTPTGEETEADSADPDAAGLPVLADVTDRAGNSVQLDLGRLRFDFTAPALDPTEAGLARLLYLRDAWGSADSGYEARLEVRIEPDTFDEPGEVRVWAVQDAAPPGGDPEGAGYLRTELGAEVFSPGEALVVGAGAVDHPVVCVTLADRAGNESDADPGRGEVQALPVASVEWVATLNGKLAGDERDNPHALLEGVTEGSAPLAVDLDTRAVAGQAQYAGAARLEDGAAARASSASAPWSVRSASTAGPEVQWPGVAWDERRARLVVFGGYEVSGGQVSATPADQTWEWEDGRGWLRRAPPTVPPARSAPALAWDAGRERVLMFGGRGLAAGACGDRSDGCADTWEWDGAAWAQRHPATVPPWRGWPALVYEPSRRKVLLFGGLTGDAGQCGVADSRLCGDTWEWDGNDWQRLDPPVAPEPRLGAAAVFDAARQRAVLFGGINQIEDALQDAWEWSGLEWVRRDPVRAPPARFGHSLAYEPTRGRTLLFGGRGDVGSNTCRAAEPSDWRSGLCVHSWGYAPRRATPHLLASFDLRTPGTIEPSSADRSTKTVLGVGLRARAGGIGHTWGTGHADGEPVPGFSAAVEALGHGGWIPLHESLAATPEAPEDWAASFDRGWSCGEAWCDDGTVDRWPGADGRLHLKLAPLAAQGAWPQAAEVALDYAELRVRYWRTGCRRPAASDPDGTPDGAPCTDGDPGTAGETCQGFVCAAP